jgi:hypothetical protein
MKYKLMNGTVLDLSISATKAEVQAKRRAKEPAELMNTVASALTMVLFGVAGTVLCFALASI